MVSLSSNDATSYILNRLCNTSTGAALSEPQLTPWIEKRKSVQRWLATHYPQISPKQYQLCHATFDESPYGRDKQARDILGSNKLSPLACAQMMAGLFQAKNLLPDHLTKIKQLLSKNSGKNFFSFDGIDQVTQFMGGGLPKEAKYWSKAGWTSQVKHETAYVSLGDNDCYVMSVFTQGEELVGKPQLFSVLTQLLVEVIETKAFN